jgi:predicted TPR repeat methyltransferase
MQWQETAGRLGMKRVIISAVLLAVLAPAALAQMATLKGLVRGVDGKPLAGAVVDMADKNTGHKYQLKTDKNGNIFSLGIAAGTYDVTVSSDGKPIDALNGFPVRAGDEATLDIDVSKDVQRQQVANPEQKKAQEQHDAERNKIKGLNEMLAQAKAASDAGNFDQAKQIMLQATQLDPNREILWFNLAEAQRNSALKATDANEKKTGLEAAVDSYNKALKLVPNTKPDVMGAIYNQMGEAYSRMGNIDQASKSYDAAAGADLPNAGKYYFNEGAILTNSGKYDDAVKAFDKSIQADPTRADAYYQKGVNLIGKATMKPDGTMAAPEGTAEAFNKYLELDPNGKYADGAKQMLAAIGAKVETTYGKQKAPPKKK